ncbi:MAG: aminotransferase class I/II-fold pyridoxal phosphate-dependent enzyme [Deltaproteobacteria bacterium]|nr:aminotransferase class I/II-fold pyridoxal phosphate-dependent enzyme [Deltaproteobacteria bacterium]MBW2498359.1 aminotransferase class I/II-fold pyridoxal phosphate-dependent enzyme [Deltaproteobacteria bacterium]
MYREIGSPQDPVVTMDGQKVIMLGSNNYLGLTSDPRVKQAAIRATERYGTGCAGSRLLNGTLDVHVALEQKLARFMNREAALVFSTGYAVNVGVLSCLLGRHDVALLDAMDHASILDGVRLSFGKALKFRHNDPVDLGDKLSRVDPDKGKLIVVDGVFSMEGDVSPLPQIVEQKKRYGARLFVDEAHSIGVFGDHGRGVAEHFGLEDEVELVMGTFSKSLATVGGFIAGSAEVVDYIQHNARAQIFTAAIPPGAVAAVSAALDIIEAEPERRAQLWENTRYMKQELEGLGFETCGSESPVIPLLIGEDSATYQMAGRLQEEGVFVNPVVTPAVPPGHGVIRTSYMATHKREHLDRALGAIAKVGRELAII